MTSTTPTDEVHDLLVRHDLPPGLIPGEVASYRFDPDSGLFRILLRREVKARFSGIPTRYRTEITGALHPGEIRSLKGVGARIGLWLPVTAIRRVGESLVFSVGKIGKRLPLGEFV
jgi:hypothetical protein